MTPPQNVPASQPQAALPDHLHLPETDGSIVENYQENPQGNLLTSSILPRLNELHPDGRFSVGQDSGIYFKHTEPPLDGCRSPDWFYVPNVPPMLDGTSRRSYVLWHELVPPLVIIEYASGGGAEERDRTPTTGKFWIYEQAIKAKYYAIFEIESGEVELYSLVHGRYVRVDPNDAGRLPIPELGVELGVWEGMYRQIETPWLRVWDATTGTMMPSEAEVAASEAKRAEGERKRAGRERKRAERERKRADNAESLAEDYRESLEEETERAEAARKEAEAARKEAELAKQQRDAEKKQREEEAGRAARLAEKLRALGIDPEAA